MTGRAEPFYCSFCGKSQHEVEKLLVGVTAFICDECVELCTGIVEEEREKLGRYRSGLEFEYGPFVPVRPE